MNAPYERLSEYCLVAMTDAGLTLLPGAVPYELNTPLFVDYSDKFRTVWMPPGTSATYDPTDVFSFPAGTIITKSFGWPVATGQPNPPTEWIETRVLYNTGSRWVLEPYLWNDAGTDAILDPGGETLPITFVGADGGLFTSQHLIPSPAQCETCHQSNGVTVPIGPKARQLNGNYSYPDGTTANQLAWWTDAGLLTGAPDPSLAPVLPVWDDPSTGTIAQRARAYIEANCAHCHNPAGYAALVGLTFWASDQTPGDYGVCDPATEFLDAGRPDVIVPGDAAGSLLVFLIDSTIPGELMAPVGRSLEDVYSSNLVESWVNELDGGPGDGGCG